MPEMTIQQALELALQHHQAGRLNEAESIYRQILTAEPHHADALHLLGVLNHQVGRNDAAIELIRQAVALTPGNPLFFSNLGEACRAAGQLDEAITAYRQAIAHKSFYPETHSNLGNALREKGLLDEAIAACRKAISLKPDFAEAHSNLGNALRDKGQLDEAISAYLQAISLKPEYPEAYNNLGVALHDKRRFDESIAAYHPAIALKPDYAEAHCNLGAALQEKGQLDESITACRQALTLNPDYPEAQNNLGNALKDQGHLDEAAAAYRQALTLKPDYSEAHSNLLLGMNYNTCLETYAISEEHRHWNQRHAEPLRQFIRLHTNDRSPSRRLRVGYVSPDFSDHPVAYFIEGLLMEHDRVQVELICYSNVMNPDAVTARIRHLAGHWRSIIGLTDAEAAELIRADGIDILVDLSGHTARNRLPVFARKPAPVQVTWLGYPNTTGLNTMDYRITDAFADPPGGTEQFHSEQLVRLSRSAWCYRPCVDSPPVTKPPANDSGHITFGCFNAMPKINEPLLELWSKILLSVPDSRLLLKNKALGAPTAQEHLRKAFETIGIAPERLELMGWVPDYRGQMKTYGRVDIALDTFPYHGTTTTCEALWMGVPVVTLAGKTHVSRVGVSLLSNLGHPQWIAPSPEEYVKLAVKMAGDIPHLADIRSTLLEKMQASPLMDAAGFARDIEAAYRNMWRTWCEQPESQPCPI